MHSIIPEQHSFVIMRGITPACLYTHLLTRHACRSTISCAKSALRTAECETIMSSSMWFENWRNSMRSRFTSLVDTSRPMAASKSSVSLDPLRGSCVGTAGEFNEIQRNSQSASSEDDETIAAIVTGPQQAAVAIIRLSGSQAIAVAADVFRARGTRNKPWKPATHKMYYGNAVDSEGHILDEVLAVAMLAPRSYTAETVVELHTHGGAVPARRVLAALLEAGARLAEPGEFTQRAFLNGRLDLSQAEAVGQLISARSSAAADSALAGLDGGLSAAISETRHEVIQVLAEVEARLDFDEDLPPLDHGAVSSRVVSVAAAVQLALDTARQGQLLHDGLQVALVGRPNVGKSSLLNALSGTQRSIVTDVAGTTRDIVEAGVTMGGIPLTLLDTAGLREATDAAEAIGVERSSAAARAADIVIMVADAEAGWMPEDEKVLQQLRPPSQSPSKPLPPLLLVVNKVDLATMLPTLTASNTATTTTIQQTPQPFDDRNSHSTVSNASEANNTPAGSGTSQTPQLKPGRDACSELVPEHVTARVSAAVATSARTGGGLDSLRAAVLAMTDAADIAAGGRQWAINERQAEALLRAKESLQRCVDSISDELPLDFWTIDLRGAAVALGEVSGHEVNEEVLDTIFSRFCIGK